MRRFWFTIASLLVVVLFLAIGFAALRETNDTWDSGLFTLALAALLTSILLAVHRTESSRAFWIGFAVFGWIYPALSLERSQVTPEKQEFRPERRVQGMARTERSRVSITSSVQTLSLLRSTNVTFVMPSVRWVTSITSMT